MEKQALQEGRQKPVASSKHVPAGSQKPLTEPEEVHFHTAKRQRTQAANVQDKVQ